MKTRTTLLPVLLIIASLFSGCVTSYESTLSNEDLKKNPMGPTEGFLVGSFAYQGENPSFFGQLANDRYSSYGYYFRSTDPGNELKGNVADGLRSFMGIGNKTDFDIKGGKGEVFILRLPEGNYEFYNYSFYDNRGSFSVTHNRKSDFSIPFKIEAGKALYVGSIIAKHTWGKNSLGMTIPTGGYHEFENEQTRDLEILTEKFPILFEYPLIIWDSL
ncbi:MAG: hypothetical protein ACPGN3_03245 [Opitutales bacterium]